MLLAEMPELGRMTLGEADSMTWLALVPRGSGAMCGRRAKRHVLFQAALAAACHSPLLKAVAKRPKEKGKPHKLVIVAIAWRLITIVNAVLKSGTPWQYQPGTKTQLLGRHEVHLPGVNQRCRKSARRKGPNVNPDPSARH